MRSAQSAVGFECNVFFTRSGVTIEAAMGARAPAVDVELFG